jgi:hypothetical protein
MNYQLAFFVGVGQCGSLFCEKVQACFRACFGKYSPNEVVDSVNVNGPC